MARSKAKRTASTPTIPQAYPRIQDETDKNYGCLDVSHLKPHPDPKHITPELLKQLIYDAIKVAEGKSSRGASLGSGDVTSDEEERMWQEDGRELFKYFHDYPVDPAGTAHDCYKKNYRDVGIETFRNRVLQKGRMNSGYRYQFLAVDCAEHSGRFRKVSSIGASKGDFHADIEFQDSSKGILHLYVSVKNRSDTLGGQDWPNAVAALEAQAKGDQNKIGPYCCVFGIAMNRGDRRIPRKRTGEAYSPNTEIWLSDFFWPFFSGYSYEEIMTLMLEVLIETFESMEELPTQIDVPDRMLDYFGAECRAAGLIDELGNFHDPFRLVQFFVNKIPPKAKRS